MFVCYSSITIGNKDTTGKDYGERSMRPPDLLIRESFDVECCESFDSIAVIIVFVSSFN